MPSHKPSRIVIALMLLAGFANVAIAAGSLVVTPTRIEFDNRTRSEQVTLLNTGSEPASYRISFVRRHMLEDGNLIEVKEDEPGRFSDEMIRYSPRQVTLPAGQSQVIRLMLRKPRNLDEGEYRSHMLFQALPEPRNEIDSKPDENPTGIKIELRPMIGITIPVIVRHGESLSATLELDSAKFLPADDKYEYDRISVDMNRTGTRSVYGDFLVHYTPEGSTESTVVSQVKGVAVYVPNEKRTYTMRLAQPPGITFEKGSFRIEYNERKKPSIEPISTEITLTRP